MAELLKQKVTKKELDEGIIPSNHILCYAHYSNENLTTKSGIIVGVNKDVLYSDADNLNDDSAHDADLQEVSFIVKKLPTALYFNKDDRDKSMPWETECELQVEDEVWTNLIEAANSITLVCEGKEYRLLPYQDLICVKRKSYAINMRTGEKTQLTDLVVILNGYVLVTLKNKESISEFDVTSADKLDKTKGVISYIGSPVKRYLNPDYSHIEDLRVGDEVLFNPKAGIFALERQKYASKFNDKQIYYVVHHKDINAVLNRK